MLCCRDAGVPAFFKVTLKAILGINTEPANDGRGSRGLRGKFYGPSLQVGYLTSAHSYHATHNNSREFWERYCKYGPQGKGNWVYKQWPVSATEGS